MVRDHASADESSRGVTESNTQVCFFYPPDIRAVSPVWDSTALIGRRPQIRRLTSRSEGRGLCRLRGAAPRILGAEAQSATRPTSKLRITLGQALWPIPGRCPHRAARGHAAPALRIIATLRHTTVTITLKVTGAEPRVRRVSSGPHEGNK